ncbi:MAG: DUF11 domain-containing protein [Bacilli bacterium]|nr:DUF11 domain-containing protein [Bacilli bacterium]
MNANGKIDFEFGLFLVDTSYKNLPDTTLKVMNYDKTKTLNVNVSRRSDKAYIFEGIVETDDALSLLPSEYQQIIKSLKTKEDVDRVKADHWFYTPLKVVEESAPTGYKKEDIIFFAGTDIDFTYDENNNITKMEINMYAEQSEIMMTKNDSSLDYSHFVSGIEIENNDRVARMCDSDNTSFYGQIATTDEDSMWGSACFEVIYFFVNEGLPELKISNTVNDVLSYNATNNRKLKYNVKVSNVGKGDSLNNIIVTNVPEGITVKEDSVSDRGVYNKSKNIITWNYSSLAPEEEHTFTYEAIVPESALTTNKYIGNSYVMSDQVVTQVKSEDTIVQLEGLPNPEEANNPKTGLFDVNIIFLLIAVLIIIFFAINKKKNYLN